MINTNIPLTLTDCAKDVSTYLTLLDNLILRTLKTTEEMGSIVIVLENNTSMEALCEHYSIDYENDDVEAILDSYLGHYGLDCRLVFVDELACDNNNIHDVVETLMMNSGVHINTIVYTTPPIKRMGWFCNGNLASDYLHLLNNHLSYKLITPIQDRRVPLLTQLYASIMA